MENILYNLNTIKIISLLILLSQAALSNELKIGLEQSVPLIPQTNIAKGLYIRSANGSPFSFEISYSKDNYLFERPDLEKRVEKLEEKFKKLG